MASPRRRSRLASSSGTTRPQPEHRSPFSPYIYAWYLELSLLSPRHISAVSKVQVLVLTDTRACKRRVMASPRKRSMLASSSGTTRPQPEHRRPLSPPSPAVMTPWHAPGPSSPAVARSGKEHKFLLLDISGFTTRCLQEERRHAGVHVCQLMSRDPRDGLPSPSLTRARQAAQGSIRYCLDSHYLP
jgi:hypothetical protein